MAQTEIENIVQMEHNSETFHAAAARVARNAHRIYAKQPDWTTFFREVLGLDGIIRQTFSSPQGLAQFEQTESYAEILGLLTELRRSRPLPPVNQEPTQVITVRLPKSVHESLVVEAHEHCTSMNKLCISKLLQFVDQKLVPTQRYGKAAAKKEEA